MRLKGKSAIGLVGASLLLAACGGGGSGGEEAATGDLTAANYAAKSEASLDSILTGLDTQGALMMAMPLSAGVPSGSVLNFNKLQQQLLERFSRRSDREQAAIVTSNTFNCTGGGLLRFTATFASQDYFVPGDKVQVGAENCYEDGLQVTGTMELVLREVVDSDSRFYLKAGLAAADFGTSAYRLNGMATLETDMYFSAPAFTLTQKSLKIGFSGFSVMTSPPQQTQTLDHSYELTHNHTHSTNTLALGGMLNLEGQRYWLEQQTPFALSSSGLPQSGAVHLKDKDGDRVIVTATPTRFTYAFQPTGSNAPTLGPVDGPLYSTLWDNGGSGVGGAGSMQPAGAP